MDVDWNQFNHQMQNMANTMHQMIPQAAPAAPQPTMAPQQPGYPFNMAAPMAVPAMNMNMNTFAPQAQLLVPSPQTQNFVTQMNNFAQQITAYSQQMIEYGQALARAAQQQQQQQQQQQPPQPQPHHPQMPPQQPQQPPPAQVLVMPPMQQQIIIHSNNNYAPFINQPPFIIINNQSIVPAPPVHENIIDLTHDEEKFMHQDEEEEEFVPWKEDEIPDNFKCPISLEIMRDPVLLNDGFCYEYQCILDWLRQHNRSPMTNLVLERPRLVQEHTLRKKIQEWTDAQWHKFHQKSSSNSQPQKANSVH